MCGVRSRMTTPNALSPRAVSRRAYAKVNLCLFVGPPEGEDATHEGRSVAGYHKIASWMSAIEVRDDVVVTPGEAFTFECDWAGDAPRPTLIDWPDERDLCVKAHKALEAKLERSLPAAIRVTKRIPVGGGLGGGSSDAASTLLALREAFQLDLDDDALSSVAMDVGSDVAFFIDGEGEGHSPPRPALVSGFGEQVERVDPVTKELILVIPPFSCETRAVYGAFDVLLAERVSRKRMEHGPSYNPAPVNPDLIARRISKAQGDTIRDGLLGNDLFPAAIRVEPRLGRLATELSRATRLDAHLSGSGSTLFFLTDADRAPKVEGRLRRALESMSASADGTWCAGCVVVRSRLTPARPAHVARHVQSR